MAYVLRQNYITGDDSYAMLSFHEHRMGQSFTPAISHTIKMVSLKMYRGGTEDQLPGTFTVGIYAVNGNGDPTGSALCSGTSDGNTLTTNILGEWRDIFLGMGTALTAAIQYAIIVNCPLAVTGDSLFWRTDITDAEYTGGLRLWASQVDNWNQYDTRDMVFKEYSNPTASGDPPLVNVTYTKKLIAVSANELWYEDEPGSMTQLTAGDIDASKGLDIVEAYGKVFIANNTNLKVADFINIKLHTTDIVPADKVYPRHKTVIEATGGTASGAKMVVDYITDLDGDTYVYGKLITAATFLNGDVCTATITEGNVSFTLDADQVNGPHWYDWTTYGNAAKDDNTFGAMPEQATIVALYQGRVVLGGDVDYPHMWYQSRQADPWNFLYGINDAQSAVAGNQADAGEIGDVVTAIIPYKDDFCIYGAAGSIWYLIGNAAEGGVILELSLTAGILAAKSWCWDNRDNLYILATTGLLKIPKGFGQPENLTEQSYPNFIKDLVYDDSTDRLTMAYDRIRHGIHICKTILSDGTNTNWWLDLKVEDPEIKGSGLFPETYPEECGVCSMFYYESNNPDYRDLLFGCYDGYIRFSDDTAKDDNIGADVEADIETIDSYVCFGPISLAQEGREGKLTSLVGILAGGGINGSQTDSGDIDYKIFTGLSAAKVLERMIAGTSPDISGTITAPGRIRGSIKRQTVRGAFVGIRVGNDDASEIWALERLLVNAKEVGRIR